MCSATCLLPLAVTVLVPPHHPVAQSHSPPSWGSLAPARIITMPESGPAGAALRCTLP